MGAVINYIFFVKIIPFSELERENKKATGEEAPKWIRMLLEGKVVIVILLINLSLACLNQVHIFVNLVFLLFQILIQILFIWLVYYSISLRFSLFVLQKK